MQKNKIILEGCIETQQEADYYAACHIDRFEICSRLDLAGLCPTIELTDYCINKLKIPSVIMLRLRNDFSFEQADLAVYEKAIKQYLKLGANQFIFGFIKNNQIDVEACKALLKLLPNAQCAFHTAIDQLGNYHRDIPILIKLGFKWVLTRGGANCASDNIATLKELVTKYDNQIKILAGGKVTAENWQALNQATGITWFHGRKIK